MVEKKSYLKLGDRLNRRRKTSSTPRPLLDSFFTPRTKSTEKLCRDSINARLFEAKWPFIEDKKRDDWEKMGVMIV